MPKRIQMSRQHPWRAENPDAVIVARPSKWGNPFAVVKDGHYWGVKPPGYANTEQSSRRIHKIDALAVAVSYYRCDAVFHVAEIRAELAGKDLACWCPLDQPCHADVLLEIANAEVAS